MNAIVSVAKQSNSILINTKKEIQDNKKATTQNVFTNATQQSTTDEKKPWWHYPVKILDKLGQSILAIGESIYLSLGLGVGLKASAKTNILGVPVDLTLGSSLDLIYIQRKPGRNFEVGERSIYFEGSLAGDLTGIGKKSGYFHPFGNHECTNGDNGPYNYDFSKDPCPKTEVYDIDDPSYDVKIGAGAELYTIFGGGSFEAGLDLEYLARRWAEIWSSGWN